MNKLIRIFLCVLMPTGLLAGPGRLWAADIRDVKPPVAFPPNFWIWLLAGLLVLLGLAVWWARRVLPRRRQCRVRVAPPLPPEVVARQRLAQLQAENLPAQGQVKLFYSRLSDIVRRYIEDRFQIRAPEMTTEEFLASLRGTPVLTAQQREFLANFLNHCDMVKFARYLSSAMDMEESLVLARRLVDETTPADSAGTPAPGGGRPAGHGDERPRR